MTEVEPVLDFASSGRSGRRNALPDILGSPAGVNPGDLPLKLAELSLKAIAAYGCCLGTRATTKQHHHSHNVFQVLKMAARLPSASLHGEKSVRTHQHISRAVNRTQDGERQTAATTESTLCQLSTHCYCVYTVL
uniref:Uncharacterized protein n=1 Tax=Amphiprion ocellaris TaxID=80972 RepID=A0AAQ5YQJ2_AMPOC